MPGLALPLTALSVVAACSAHLTQRSFLRKNSVAQAVPPLAEMVPAGPVAAELPDDSMAPTPCLRDFTDRGCMPHCWSQFMQCVRGSPVQDVLTGLAEVSLASGAAEIAAAQEGNASAQADVGGLSLIQEGQQHVSPVPLPSLGDGLALKSSSYQLVDGLLTSGFARGNDTAMSMAQIGEAALVTAFMGTLFVGLFLITCFFPPAKAPRPPPLAPKGSPRPRGLEMSRWVEKLPISSSRDVVRALRPRGGYDCLLTQPREVAHAVRVEGRVVAPPQGELTAPLTGRRCVLFSTSVVERRLDGVQAPPLAFSALSVDFEVELQAQDALRVRLRGQDVALFDMAGGVHREQVSLREAAEHLQAFVYTHKCGALAGGSAMALEFTESFLAVDTVVTCVGELRRAPSGEIWLSPLRSPRAKETELDSVNDICAERLMVSDSPRLLSAAAP